MNLFSFDTVYRKYHYEESIRLLADVCQVTGYMAIGSAKLTDYMRRKYKDSRVRVGRNSLYLFKKDEIPSDIFYKVVRPSLDGQKQAF